MAGLGCLWSCLREKQFRRKIRATRDTVVAIGPAAPSLGLGIVVAASFLVVETLVVCSLNVLTNTTGCFATIYLLGVLVVPTLWGFGLSATFSVVLSCAPLASALETPHTRYLFGDGPPSGQ